MEIVRVLLVIWVSLGGARPVLCEEPAAITATWGSHDEFYPGSLGSPAFQLASKYGAEVASSNGTNYSWSEWMEMGYSAIVQDYPVTMTVQVPYVRVTNSLPREILIQQAYGSTCQRLAPGGSRRFPLAAAGVTMFDAIISLGGAYWIREASANCSTECRDCFWWWTDPDKPRGAFLAQVGFGPGIPMMFFESVNESEMRPKSYAGISALELNAHRWTLDGVDDGIETGLDWNGRWSGAVALDEVVAVNCSVGASYCGKMIKPFRVAEIEILGDLVEQPSQPSLDQKYDQHRGAGLRHGAVPWLPIFGLVLASAAFLAVYAGSRHRHRRSRVSDDTDPCIHNAEQTTRLITA